MMKIILLIVAFALAVVGVFVSRDMLGEVGVYLVSHLYVLALVAVAIILQFAGHVLRALRTKLILDQAASSSLKFQFGALSIGYLFNTILPFRLCELVRALVVARRLHISLLYTFAAVIIERTADIVFISVLVIAGVLFLGGIHTTALVISVIALAIAGSILVFLVLLKNENKHLLRVVSLCSQIFSTSISNGIRFKVWTLIFGLQSFFGNPRYVRQYVTYALVSWVCYFMSALVIFAATLPALDGLRLALGGLLPYTTTLTTAGVFDIASYQQLSQAVGFIQAAGDRDIYAMTTWVIMMLPIALVGLVALILYKNKQPHVPTVSKADSYVNKLLRYDDISQDFPVFLETYFQGSNLTRILHKIEVSGGLSLVKFFKGGSDAITVLALQNDKMYVKKIVPAEYTDRLRTQYLWLQKYAKKRAIVDVIAEHKTDDYYAIDLSYNPENISLFEYVHNHSLAQSKRIIDDVWSYVFKHVYSLHDEGMHEKKRDIYIQERLVDKIKKAVMVNEDLQRVIGADKVTINGEVYDNFYSVLDKIKNHKQAWSDLAIYRESTAIHGDLTVDNILVDTRSDKPVIIDPSDDNQIRGPIIDFARHTQSLIAGYEFLNADDGPVKADIHGDHIEINYHDRRSARYMQLYEYVDNTIGKKYLTETERRTALFHTGLLYGRMLAHRVVINPHNTLKYYAISVMLLNEFYRQYEKL